jgi:hypothetical protein
MKKYIPVWLSIIVIIETLPMFIGPVVAVFFPSKMPGFGGAIEATGPMFIYAARNLAVGFAFVLVFALKDNRMLFILIFIRFITDLIDLPTGLYFGGFSSTMRAVMMFVLFYYIPAVYALKYLWKEIKEEI